MYQTIYLVDDEHTVNLIHRSLLGKLGLAERAREFTDPLKALMDLLGVPRADVPILILLDINMPELSGYEFLETLVKEGFPPSVDVVVITSSISKEDTALLKKFPQFVRNFVVKPLALEQLQDIIAQAYGPRIGRRQ